MPEIAWRRFYRKALDNGYSLLVPNTKERADFRKYIVTSYGLNPRENPLRAVYVTGKDGKFGSNFFGDESLLNASIDEIIAMQDEAIKGRKLIATNITKYHRTPSEIVADRMAAGQNNIEFIDPLMYDMILTLFWKKVNE